MTASPIGNTDSQRERLRRIADAVSDPGSPSGAVTFDDTAFLLRLIEEFTDPDPCSYDHNGSCQAHSLHEKPCPHEIAQVLND